MLQIGKGETVNKSFPTTHKGNIRDSRPIHFLFGQGFKTYTETLQFH